MTITQLKENIQYCRDQRRIYSDTIYFEKTLYEIRNRHNKTVIVEDYTNYEALEEGIIYFEGKLTNLKNYTCNTLTWKEADAVLLYENKN